MATELGEGPFSLETRWIRPLGSGYSGIAIGGGLLVTAGRGDGHDVVVALDPENGSERWRYALDTAYDGHDGSHDGPIVTPAIADGRVFMVGAAGSVAALRLEDGAELWTRHLVEDFGSVEPRYGFAGSPAVAGSILVLSIGGEDAGSLAGFDVATGKLRWRSLPDTIYGGSPIVAEVGGRPQVLMLSPSFVTGLDPATGTILWQEEHGEKNAAMGALSQSVLPLDSERFFVKHGEDRVMVLEVSCADGAFVPTRLAEFRGLTRSYSPPTRVDGVLYGYTGRLLSAVDPAAGELLWRSRAPGDGFLLALGDQLAVLSKKGTLHLAAASRNGWEESDRLELFEDLAWTPPSAAGQGLYARSLGQIARVDLRQGGTPRAAPAFEPPRLLRPLAATVAAMGGETERAANAVDRFLDGRELPWVDGEDVLFLWRGAAGDVAIAGDMLGIRREEVMHRLEGTDLWWWQTRLDRRSRISYQFFVDDEPTVDPSHLRRTHSTIPRPGLELAEKPSPRDVLARHARLARLASPGPRTP
ncbi:MAG: PQQ-binding-like beta-propeller repeat protein [Acidobacteriota bacterium]